MITNVLAAADPPVDLHVSPAVGSGMNIGMAVAVVVVVVLLTTQAVRDRAWHWVVVIPACSLCGFLEPLFDILGGTWYAADTPLMADVMGRPIPLYIWLIYASYLPLGFWLCYLVLKRGPVSTKTMLTMWVGGVVGVVAFERMFMIHVHLSVYYGDNPALFLGYPVYSVIQNAALPILGAALVMWAKERLPGARSLLLIPIVPGAFACLLIIQTWPTYVALNSDTAPTVRYAVAVITVALNAGFCGSALFSKWMHDLQTRATAPDHAAGPPRVHAGASGITSPSKI